MHLARSLLGRPPVLPRAGLTVLNVRRTAFQAFQLLGEAVELVDVPGEGVELHCALSIVSFLLDVVSVPQAPR